MSSIGDLVYKIETRDVCHVVEFNEDAKSSLYGILRILLVGIACVLYYVYTIHFTHMCNIYVCQDYRQE